MQAKYQGLDIVAEHAGVRLVNNLSVWVVARFIAPARRGCSQGRDKSRRYRSFLHLQNTWLDAEYPGIEAFR
ncbi:MAG: hypothetical protein V2A61_01810 [Calditrichota bacterium]